MGLSSFLKRKPIEREAIGRQALERDTTPREATSREGIGRDTIGRETIGRETVNRELEPAFVDEVGRARTLARQRLIGAAVLLAVGVIGFPLVFETQPRPIPIDIPIDIPRKDGAPPLVLPSAQGSSPAREAPAAASVPEAPILPPAADDVIIEPREAAGRGVAPTTGAPIPGAAASRAPSALASKSPAQVRAEAKSDANDDGARARALLDGKPPPAADAARFIVQVGAFADANAAHDTRLKIEKLGMKTYTQVASTPAGDRIRVRVGPFGTRDEADRALAKARSAGLSAVVLAL